jgi:hypothetical protein
MAAEQAAKRAAKPALVRIKALSKQYVQRRAFSRSKFVVDALNKVDLEIQPSRTKDHLRQRQRSRRLSPSKTRAGVRLRNGGVL